MPSYRVTAEGVAREVYIVEADSPDELPAWSGGWVGMKCKRWLCRGIYRRTKAQNGETNGTD